MDVGKLKIVLMECLTEERYEHVLRVTETAKKLAERFAIPVEKAEQAALFHDIAKCMDKRNYIRFSNVKKKILGFFYSIMNYGMLQSGQ